jgi:hypothetical protein
MRFSACCAFVTDAQKSEAIIKIVVTSLRMGFYQGLAMEMPEERPPSAPLKRKSVRNCAASGYPLARTSRLIFPFE